MVMYPSCATACLYVSMSMNDVCRVDMVSMSRLDHRCYDHDGPMSCFFVWACFFFWRRLPCMSLCTIYIYMAVALGTSGDLGNPTYTLMG